jgi:hypothetical protein
MLDKIGSFLTLLVVGSVSFHIITNKNSANTLGTVFHGVAEDVEATTAG